MTATLRTGLLVVLAIVAVLVLSSTYVVDQRQQALVLRLNAVRDVVRSPGLYFKVPIIENVLYLDRRILDLDLPAQEVIASDQKRLVVDAYARYRIVDPLRFYQSVGTISGASNRLGSIVSSTVRGVLGDATFTDVVRTEREALMRQIRERVNTAAGGLGVEIVDVRLRRVDLPEQNSQAVFQRMQTERQREATDLRAQGAQQGQSIRARADRDVTGIVAEANRKADESRGRGEAEKNRILAEAFGQDPDFFAFYRSLQAYEIGLKPGETKMLLSPSSDFFRFFRNSSGQPTADPGTPPATGSTGPRPARP